MPVCVSAVALFFGLCTCARVCLCVVGCGLGGPASLVNRVDAARLQLRLGEAPALGLDASAYTIRGGRPDAHASVLHVHGLPGTTDEAFVLDECRCVAARLLPPSTPVQGRGLTTGHRPPLVAHLLARWSLVAR